MATGFNKEPENLLQIYKCTECPWLWMSRKSKLPVADKCQKCKQSYQPLIEEKLEGKEKSLFDGKLRCFGIYKCSCLRHWQSANSWSRKGQRCNNSCDEIIFAHRQTPLGSGGGRRDRPGHSEEKCLKCHDIKQLCTGLQAFHMRDVTSGKENTHNKNKQNNINI